jgi:TetR/AcrR family transcriptional repressor of nem operon
MAQSTPTTHKERLLRQGMKLFYANGFHGTTVDAVLAASGVPKGSFYHHFRSKDAFGLAVLDRYMTLQLGLLAAADRDGGGSTGETLERYFATLGELFVASEFQRGCLAGKFSTEMAAASDSFRAQLAHAMGVWHDTLTDMLRHGQQRGDVRADRSAADLAHTVLALVQGAFVIALSSRDTAALSAVGASIRILVEAGR